MKTPSELSVGFVQPSLRLYRLPFYRALSSNGDLRLRMWADPSPHGAKDAVDRLVDGIFTASPVRRLGPFLLQSRLREAAIDSDLDVLVLPWNSRLLGLSRAVRVARRHAGVVLWGHGFGKRETTLRRFARNRIAALADAIVVYSSNARDRLLQEGFASESVFVAPNAIDQTPIRRAKEAWTPARLAEFTDRAGVSGSECVVYVSRLEPWKRVDLAIDAFSRLRNRRESAKLLVIGDGSDRSRLESLADRLVPGGVMFLGAIYRDEDLAPWMLSARLMAYPRALGLSLFHAFGFGLPVVTCLPPGGHGPEFDAIEPGRNGLLFPDGDLDAMARVIERILDSDDLHRTLSAGASATVDGPGGFDIPGMVAGFRKAIDYAADCAHLRSPRRC